MITFQSNSEKFLHLIDMRQQKHLGVETYDANSIIFKLRRIFDVFFNDVYVFHSVNNNIIFSKKSLNEFLSKNLEKKINVDKMSEELVINKIHKVAEIFSKLTQGQPIEPKYKPIAVSISIKKPDQV